jgi:glycosyltransferase involved in cell wall biosynthesis
MRIAILGSRGIPGNYGGFETCAEELATRLVECGHEVSVYCCKPYSRLDEAWYRGVRRVVLPTIRHKSLEKVVYSVLSLVHVLFAGADVVLVLGIAAAPFCFIPGLARIPVVLNTDGLEWRRRKWGRLASRYLRFAERAACFTATRLVTDARCVKEYYRDTYGAESTFIPYGARPAPPVANGTLGSLGVDPDNYLLYVSRFDPENNGLLVRRAFEGVRTDMPLLMVGSAPFADGYVRQVRDTTDPRVRFPGAIYGDGYLELQSGAHIYIQATEVGGTHPALVEAIGLGRCVIANDVPEHREVLGDAGLYYDGTVSGLRRRLQEAIDHPDLVEGCRARARVLAERYSWDRIVRDYETLFEAVRPVRARRQGSPC